MKVYARTDIGKVRPINEDSFYLPREGESFCAVADGMGGHNAGEVASEIAVNTFAECMRTATMPTEVSMRTAVEQANRAIYDAAQSEPERNGMGTTFTSLCLDSGIACIAHVGDSRTYLIRNSAIMKLTTDHTLVEEMLVKGLITPQEAKVHTMRNYVTRALGTMESVEIDTFSLETQQGDLFLLCSDGLSGMLDEREMLDCAMEDRPYGERIEHMIDIALTRGGHDNITVLLVVCEEAVR